MTTTQHALISDDNTLKFIKKQSKKKAEIIINHRYRIYAPAHKGKT